MVTEAQVMEALKDCYDPEIPVNIVDLGLVYEVAIENDADVKVKMTLTTRGCHMGGSIAGEAQARLMALPGVKTAQVDIVWEPPWTPERLSADAKKRLGIP